MEQVGRNLSNVGSQLSKTVSLPILAVGGAALKMAVDAVEAENLFEVSFENMADAAREWSEETGKALGLNRVELRKNAGTIFVMVEQMGIATDAAFDMSTGMTELANDMASFFNLRPEEAFQKLRSGIVGETEPLRRLGILVDEATIKNVAYAQGIVEVGQELTQTQKVQARWLAIQEQTVKIQGDLARTMESPANQLRRLRTQIEEAAIRLGTALLPAFQQTLSLVEKLTSRLEPLVNAFAGLSPPVQRVIIVLTALVAAAGPALFITGQLVTSWGALATAAPALAGGIARVLAFFTGPAGWIAAGVATLATWRPVREFLVDLGRTVFDAVRNGITRVVSAAREWWASTEKGRQFLAALHEVIRRDIISVLSTLVDWTKRYVQQQIEAARMAVEMARAFLEWSGALKAVQFEIERATLALRLLAEWTRKSFDRIVEWVRQMGGLSRVVGSFDPVLGAMLAKMENWAKRAKASVEWTDRLSGSQEGASESAEELTEWQRRMDEAAAGVLAEVEALNAAEAERERQLKQSSEAVRGAVKSMKEQVSENQALLDALLESQQAYDVLNVLLEAGVPLNEALSGAYNEQAQALLRASAALEKELSLREEEKELLTSILDLREKIARLKESSIDLGDIEMPEMEPVFPELDPAALEKMTEDWRNTLGQMSTEMEALQKRAWENIQDIASDAIAEIVKTGEVDFENLFDSILDVVAQMLAKMLVMWLANLAKRVAAEQSAAAASAAAWAAAGGAPGVGTQAVSGGSGMWGMGNALVAMGNTGGGWASTLAAAAPLLAVAAFALWGYARAASTQMKHTGGQVTFGRDPQGNFTQAGVSFNDQLATGRAMREALAALQETFFEIERITGATIGVMEQVEINVKNNGRIWVNIGNRLSAEVGSMAEAIDLAVTELLRTAEIIGSPALAATLRNTTAESLDALQREITMALRSEELFLGVEGRTAIRERTAEFFDILRHELESGIIEAQGGSGALRGLVQFYQQSFDRLMGIQRDAAEQARMDARAHNAALQMDRALLLSMRARLIGEGALARAGIQTARIQGGQAQVMVQMAEITATSAEVQAGYAEVMAAGAEVTHGMTEVQAAAAQAAGANAQAQGALAQSQAAGAQVALSAAEANAAALRAIDEALAMLEGLDVDLDAAAAAARRAAQGAGGVSPMEQLRETLEQMAFDRLLAGMTELEAGLARLDREYQRQLEVAGGNAELVAALTEEYRLQAEQLLRNIQLAAVDTFQGFMGIGQDPFAQLGQGFDDAVSAIEDAGFGAERTARMIDRLTASYGRQLDVLSREEFVSIGDSLMGIVDRYFSGVEGFEEFRMQLEQTRFQLELANLRARFEILKAEGTLAQAVLNQIQGVFDFIDENPIDWGSFVAPAVPQVQRAARDVNNAFEEMARRLNSAKDSIRDFLTSLQTGAFGGRSNLQAFEAAQDQFQKLRQQAQAGNIQAIEQFPEVARRFLEISRERFASGAEFQSILDQVESTGIGLLGTDRVTQDNVVFDQRFFQGQQDQSREIRSVAEISDRGFAAVSQDLGQLVAENRMLRERVEGIEDELRLRRQAEERKSA